MEGAILYIFSRSVEIYTAAAANSLCFSYRAHHLVTHVRDTMTPAAARLMGVLFLFRGEKLCQNLKGPRRDDDDGQMSQPLQRVQHGDVGRR